MTRIFPQAQVQVGGGTDYPYRARIDREEVAQRVAEAVRGIRYPNFKSTVDEEKRHEAYLQVWGEMADFQESGHR